MSHPIYTLKNSQGLLGVRTIGNPIYIVGFHSRLHAYIVRDHLCSKTALTLLHNRPSEDVTRDVEMGLLKMGVLKEVSNIHINLGSELVIPKKPQHDTSPVFDVFQMEYGKFLLKPFQQRIGVIEALSLSSESASGYAFLSNVIYPVEDTEMFRANLR